MPLDRTLCALSLAVLLAACADQGDDAGSEAVDGETTPAPQASSGSPATTITVTLTGGPHAGTYEATSDGLTCSHGLVGENVWGNQYSIFEASPSTFSSLQLVVQNSKDAADGTSEFMTTVGFGQVPTGATYHIEPAKKEGSGEATVEDRGESGTVKIKGTTKDGVGVEAEIRCHRLMKV